MKKHEEKQKVRESFGEAKKGLEKVERVNSER